MRKIFLVFFLSMCIGCYAQPRYFMQTPADIVSDVPYGENEKAGDYAISEGAKIYYETYGEGTPIVVLHGGGLGCMFEMNRIIDKLVSDHKVIAISTRGHGKSETGKTELTYRQKGDDIAAVLNKIGIDAPVQMIGFSDGGYSAYSFAINYPERVSKIVTIGSGEIVPGLRKMDIQLGAFESFDADFIKQQKAIMPDPENWQLFLTNYSNFYNTLTISKNVFNNLKCPVLFMVGENDQNSPVATVLAAYYMTPQAQLAVISNAPHQAFITDFDAVWPQISKFLKEK